MTDQHAGGSADDPDKAKPAEPTPPSGDSAAGSAGSGGTSAGGTGAPPTGADQTGAGQTGPGQTGARPGPYQGVFGASGQQPPAPPQYDPAVGGERPGPYQGAFGQQSAPNPWGQPQNPYAYQPVQTAPPKQVTIASAISFGLGGLCVLLGLFSLTSAGAQIAETLTGSPDAQGVVVVAILLSSVLYILPAIFVRKRRPWARVMLIVVAVIGIAGGAGALPGSLIGVGLHAALLVLMLQQPTKLWFQRR
jgi:hypothetical protein